MWRRDRRSAGHRVMGKEFTLGTTRMCRLSTAEKKQTKPMNTAMRVENQARFILFSLTWPQSEVDLSDGNADSCIGQRISEHHWHHWHDVLLTSGSTTLGHHALLVAHSAFVDRSLLSNMASLAACMAPSAEREVTPLRRSRRKSHGRLRPPGTCQTPARRRMACCSAAR